jgi:predicted MFS family arabinose efflux permease
MMASGGLGAITASAPVEAMLEIVGWRGVFWVLAAASFAAAAAVFLVVPDRRGEGEPESLARMAAGYGRIFANARFWRIALVAMTVQAGFLAVQGLWVGAWFADVAGLSRTALSVKLLYLAVATTAGFAFFGWFSDHLAAKGVTPLTVFKAGAALAAAALAVIAFVPALAGLAAWLMFNFFSASAPIGYAILSREFPRELAGRVNTAVNLLIFVAAFSIQWGLGAIVDLWERAAGHYPPAAYAAALGALLAAQLVALAGVATLRGRV